MNFLNISNIHDDSNAQVKIGLKKKTRFSIKNSGKQISIEDDANTINSFKIGGSNGFTITFTGSKIVFSSNSGTSPLTVVEPYKGGILECPYYYCHQDKFSGVSATTSVTSASLLNSSNVSSTVSASMQKNIAAPMLASIEDTPTEDNNDNKSNFPDASNLSDGTMMIVQDGHWTEITKDELINEIAILVKSELSM